MSFVKIGLYTNFTSFTSFSYKTGLIKTLLQRAFGISSSWNFFGQEKKLIKNLLMNNLYPFYLLDKEIKKFLEYQFTTNENTSIIHNSKSVSYYKLPYIASYSNSTKKKKFYVKYFAKTPILKLFFHRSNCSTYFLQTIVCQLLWSPFLWANFNYEGCQSCYIEETKHHLPTRIKEHMQTDTKSQSRIEKMMLN